MECIGDQALGDLGSVCNGGVDEVDAQPHGLAHEVARLRRRAASRYHWR